MKSFPIVPPSIEDFKNTNLEEDLRSADQILERIATPVQLSLVAKKIPIKFAEYKISNVPAKMIQSETISISTEGLTFLSPLMISVGALTRVWLEVPDYWSKKSRLVAFRHTEAPTYFQILCRIQKIEETGKRNQKHLLTAVIMSLDPVDEKVLREYLGLGDKNT